MKYTSQKMYPFSWVFRTKDLGNNKEIKWYFKELIRQIFEKVKISKIQRNQIALGIWTVLD